MQQMPCLLDHLGDEVQPRVREWGDRLEALTGVALADTVLAQAQAHVPGMRHRLDAARIDRLQLFDEREHALQLCQHLWGLRLADLDAGKLRNSGNIQNGQGHGRYIVNGGTAAALSLSDAFK